MVASSTYRGSTESLHLRADSMFMEISGVLPRHTEEESVVQGLYAWARPR